jgi:hypothetical protein
LKTLLVVVSIKHSSVAAKGSILRKGTTREPQEKRWERTHRKREGRERGKRERDEIRGEENHSLAEG